MRAMGGAPDPVSTPARKRSLLRTVGRGLLVALAVALALPLLFVLNGTVLATDEAPVLGVTAVAPADPTGPDEALELRVVAYNIAKGFAHEGGLAFADAAEVRARLLRMAATLRGARPDFVFLSEALRECGPTPVDQVVTLAEATRMHAWAFGEDYNFGLPLYRVVGGNAILSRYPLEPVKNLSLVGRQPFYVTTNNRRALFASVRIQGASVLLGGLHADSFDAHNRLAQLRQLLAFVGRRPAVLAGDFNARPEEAPIQALRASGRFHGAFDGPPTFPAEHPEQRLDYVLAPPTWELVEDRVLASDASDHLPVLATFRIPARAPRD